EVWVNGKLPVVLGQSGGPMVAGFNSPNRVVIGRDMHPGQKVQIAVFAANGPMSNPPPNYLWVGSAALEFYQSVRFGGSQVPVTIERLDPVMDRIAPAEAKLEKLATGFQFT